MGRGGHLCGWGPDCSAPSELQGPTPPEEPPATDDDKPDVIRDGA